MTVEAMKKHLKNKKVERISYLYECIMDESIRMKEYCENYSNPDKAEVRLSLMELKSCIRAIEEELNTLDDFNSCALLETRIDWGGYSRVVKRGTLEHCVELYNTLIEKDELFYDSVADLKIVTDAECSRIMSENY